jgi:hypothetical protein
VKLSISSWFVRSISWLYVGSELFYKPRLVVDRFRIGHELGLIRLSSSKEIWNVAFLGLSQTIQLALLKPPKSKAELYTLDFGREGDA